MSPTVVAPYRPPAENLPPKGFSSFRDYNESERLAWSITPHKVQTGGMQNTTIGANKTDFFEDEQAQKHS